jgi:hypothetical protein
MSDAARPIDLRARSQSALAVATRSRSAGAISGLVRCTRCPLARAPCPAESDRSFSGPAGTTGTGTLRRAGANETSARPLALSPELVAYRSATPTELLTFSGGIASSVTGSGTRPADQAVHPGRHRCVR